MWVKNTQDSSFSLGQSFNSWEDSETGLELQVSWWISSIRRNQPPPPPLSGYLLILVSFCSCRKLAGILSAPGSVWWFRCRGPGLEQKETLRTLQPFYSFFVFALENLGILHPLSRDFLNLLLCFYAHRAGNPRRKAEKGTFNRDKVKVLRIVLWFLCFLLMFPKVQSSSFFS